ncbi:MAG: hypothetical protein KFW21_04420 [Spirochaetota bacterium]|nr:hypothetical protein [Spirochaetota bacterium]
MKKSKKQVTQFFNKELEQSIELLEKGVKKVSLMIESILENIPQQKFKLSMQKILEQNNIEKNKNQLQQEYNLLQESQQQVQYEQQKFQQNTLNHYKDNKNN